ncbi:hypothetical protein I7I50_04377 [Histoplasma capsulatum G186AR]|uniref:Uncharacterized protein n=1 Tax=Ajellomyces capsulatus TaxID=5037 RepID=A0A8H7YQJ7_AJECA|nr:hypothetical protein I7I52_05285 [Histoplasma capsulatum]QSS75286.1 hypothetical protein I7I50_04377 [Histoplasma capsulatum G186AR]
MAAEPWFGGLLGLLLGGLGWFDEAEDSIVAAVWQRQALPSGGFKDGSLLHVRFQDAVKNSVYIYLGVERNDKNNMMKDSQHLAILAGELV